MKNKLIIFDCFGVIFGEIAPIFFKRHFNPEQAAILKDKFFVPADKGEVTTDELFKKMASELGMKKEDILKEWDELTVLKAEMIPVIEKLHETYDIALLSNAPLGFVEKLMKENSLEYLFDKIFISCNLKMAKPDPEIYKYCVKQFNKDYENIYMIDDNLKNLEPLPSLGITPVHFTGIEKMLSELE